MTDLSNKYYYRYDYYVRIKNYFKGIEFNSEDTIKNKNRYNYFLSNNFSIANKYCNNEDESTDEESDDDEENTKPTLKPLITENTNKNNGVIVPIIEVELDINNIEGNKKNPVIDLLNLLMPNINEKKNNVTNIKRKLPIEWTDEELVYEHDIIEEKLETIDDLINLGKQYNNKYKSLKKRYNINLRVLSDLVEPLTELNNMIGMKNIKQSIFDKIILYLQGLDNKNTDFLHTVIYGAPGMGKTEVAKIIGKIYTKMGLLSKGDFKEVRLTDLKAGYVGQSELKTQKVFDDAKGCVLFMDEAYSLGSDDKLDQYSQSIIDVINPYLDKYKDDFIFIVAGYKDDLQHRFFRGNQGLRSRFGLWLEIDDYKGIDLLQIFKKKVRDYNWNVKEEGITSKFFDEHLKDFKYFGRDIENLFSKCKISHAKRVLYGKPADKKILTKEDLDEGFKIYKKELDMEKKDTQFERIKTMMYL